jgi:hypothetical protein
MSSDAQCSHKIAEGCHRDGFLSLAMGGDAFFTPSPLLCQVKATGCPTARS